MKKKLLLLLASVLLIATFSVVSVFAAEKNYLWPLPVQLGESYGGVTLRIPSNGGWRIPSRPSHQGIDVIAAAGTPIYASKSGIARDATGSTQGTCVTIFHEDGWATCYMHMSKMAITDGQRVKQGDLIGYVGTTGSSTGNHLHFEISRVKNTSNYWTYDTIDPMSVAYVYDTELHAPTVKLSKTSVFPSESVKISWDEVARAQKYQINIKKGGTSVYSTTTTTFSKSINFQQKGTYEVTVTAINGDQKKASTAVQFNVSGSVSNAIVTVESGQYKAEWLKPGVTVKANGKTLKKGTDYTLKYSSNKYPGTGKVKITGIGNYSGGTTATFKIYLAKPTLLAASGASSSIGVSWKKSSLAQGYQIYRSTTGAADTYQKVTTIKSGTTLKYTNKSLSSGTRYYYKIRAYRVINGKTYYSSFTSATSATTSGKAPALSVSVKVKITSGTLNARAGAGTSYAITGSYNNGDTLKVTSVSGKWLKTSKGWVSSDYVTATSAVVTGSDVNCRKTASTSGSVVKRLDKGTSLKIYAKSGDWYLTSAGGWVIKDYLKAV